MSPRSCAVEAPVSSATRTLEPASIRPIDAWCCSARISVGAMIAACFLEAAAISIAYSATTVLPAPTSPWISRFVGVGWLRSRATS